MGKVIGCGFCPETANITGEHLWSDWFGRGLGTKVFTVTRKEANGSIKQWTKNELNEKARVVCGTYNSGWMSRLEQKFKTVAGDMAWHCTPKVLQAPDIAVLATNAFKCSIVADLMHDNRPPFFGLLARRRFAQSLTIPAGVQMWIGSLVPSRGIFKSYYYETPLGTSDGFELNVFTYAQGHLLIQVLAARWRKKTNRRRALAPRLTQSPDYDAISIPFWPSDGTDIGWPPPMHLGHEIISEFVNRWQRIRRLRRIS